MLKNTIENKVKNLKIAALIFDLGGVLFDLDIQRTVSAFEKLGVGSFGKRFTPAQEDFFSEFEKGKISAADFRNTIRKFASKEIDDDKIDSAWNAMLMGLPQKSITLIERIRECGLPVFLLSNTNEIHWNEVTKMISHVAGGDRFFNLFNEIFLSHKIKMRKPDAGAFELILNKHALVNSQTLFIDDSSTHIAGAKHAGLQTLHFTNSKPLEDLLREAGLQFRD